MKRTTNLFLTSIVLSIVLVGCNSGNEQDQETPDNSTDSSEVEGNNSDQEENEKEEDNEVDQNDAESENNTSDEDSDNDVLAEGEFEDQLELRIGDTGNIETTIGKYSITLNQVEILDEIEGEISELDYFVLANYTIKNEGEEEVNAADAISSMEFTDDLEVSGFPDYSEYYESIESIEGNIAPGEEVSGYAVYDAYDSEENYLRITDGLVASGAAKNQLRFTFQKSEIQ